MPINYDVYGQPETWHDCYYGGGSTQPWAALLHAERAKVPTWDTAHSTENPTFENSQLRYAVDDNKLTPREPIDNSICAVGQGTASPFRQFAIFRNDATTEHQNGEIRQVGHAYTGVSYNDNNIVNTFWFESNSFTTSGLYGNGAFSRGRLQIRDGATITQGIDQRIWSPSGVNAHGTNRQNGNFYIAPFLSYGSRTYVLQILVWVTNADYDPNFTPGTGTPAGQWRTLDDWKNNYSTKAITACLLTPRVISTYNSSTGAIGYFRVNFESSQYRKVGCGILDTIKFEFDDGYTLPDLTDYGLFSANSNANIGVALFNEMTLYKWSDTLQNIGIVNSYIASYIRSNGQFMTPYIPYSADIYDWIMSAAACFGMAFTPAKAIGTDASNCVFNQEFTDPDLCLPIIANSGIANGEYTRGVDNVNNDFIDLSSQWDKNYTPSAPVDKNTYSNQTTFNVIGAGASMNKRYLLDAANVNKLATDLFTICDTMSQNSDYSFFDSKVKANMLTQSPIESIVSLIRYPFTPTHGSTKQTVKLGRFDASAEGYPISNAIQTITFAGVDIFPRFGNCFLDYEPYTKYEVYVPFCDTVELSAADILGHTLNVRLVVDLFTGVCTGYILADSLCIETTTGNVGVNLPLTGLDTATINANIANAEANKKAAKKNYIKGHFDIITQKDKVGALWTQILGTNEDVVKKADYDLKHIEAPMHTIGAASPVTSWAMDLNARIMIYYPTGDAVTSDTPPALKDLTTYAHTTGFATIDNAALSNYRGFTVATNAILNFAATKTEKEMIESALNGGIFI